MPWRRTVGDVDLQTALGAVVHVSGISVNTCFASHLCVYSLCGCISSPEGGREELTEPL